MKTKIVLWGTNEKDEKLLIAIELVPNDNKIKIYTFPEEVATEEFYNQMMNLWRVNNNVHFPENHQVIEKELSITEDILPETIRVERTDLINRAKTEWHFVVLSSKLHQSYKTELEDIKEKVSKLEVFESDVWDEMKDFWNKVQAQAREKNLFRGHAEELREITNSIFESLKSLKKAMNKEFESISRNNSTQFFGLLEKIEGRIEKGLGLQPIFNELKSIQSDFKNSDLTKSDRSKVWKRLDAAFKKVKEKKFGAAGPTKTGLERVNRRYDGLMSAIQKMQQSIDRDRRDMGFQTKRIESTDGQLEMQIRQAKMKMIEERVRSKEEKLADMQKTKAELEKKMELEKKRDEERKVKQEIKAQEAKVKEKIAQDIETKKEDLQQDGEKLEKAAEQIKESKQPKQKAAAPKVDVKPAEAVIPEVTEEKITEGQDKQEKTVEQAEEIKTDNQAEKPNDKEVIKESKETIEEEVVAEEAPAEGDADSDNNGLGKAAALAGGVAAVTQGENIIDAITETIGEAVENVVDTVKAVAEVVEDKIEEVIEGVKEDIQEATDQKSEPVSDDTTSDLSQSISEENPSSEEE